MQRQLLVTGGAGFIGSNFCHYWVARHPDDELIVLDALTYAGKRENIAVLEDRGALTFIKGDVCDQTLVESLLKDKCLDTIVHFAAESHVDRSITGPDAFIQSNIVGTHNLLKAAKRVWLDDAQNKTGHHFHHISTDEVYGSLGPNDPPFTETTPYAPNSPYSASKAASDHLVRAYHHTYGLKVTTSNCSNNYGPYQDQEKFIPTIIRSILQGQSIPVYGDGKNVRDWLYVEDHCRAIELILDRGESGEVYNVGGENEKSNLELLDALCELTDSLFRQQKDLCERFSRSPAAVGLSSKELISFVEDRLGHDRRYAIDPGKCQSVLGYTPGQGFKSGLKKTLLWYLGLN